MFCIVSLLASKICVICTLTIKQTHLELEISEIVKFKMLARLFSKTNGYL